MSTSLSEQRRGCSPPWPITYPPLYVLPSLFRSLVCQRFSQSYPVVWGVEMEEAFAAAGVNVTVRNVSKNVSVEVYLTLSFSQRILTHSLTLLCCWSDDSRLPGVGTRSTLVITVPLSLLVKTLTL